METRRVKLKRLFTGWFGACTMAVLSAGCSANAERTNATDEAPVASASAPLLSTGTSGIDGARTLDSVTLSRGNNIVDQFIVEPTGRLSYWDFDNVWHFTDLGPGVIRLSSVAAVNVAGTLGVFALGSTGKIYFRRTLDASVPPNWSNWSEVPNTGAIRSGSRLAATEYFGAMHLFWVTSAQEIGHAWTDSNFAWAGHDSGANNAWLHPVNGPAFGDIEAVTVNGSIHLFFKGSLFGLHHHWSGNGGGHEELHTTGLGILDGEFLPFSLAATADPSGDFYVFATMSEAQDPRCDTRYAQFHLNQWNSLLQPQLLSFNCLSDQVGPLNAPRAALTLESAHFRIENGLPYVEIWGGGDTSTGLRVAKFND